MNHLFQLMGTVGAIQGVLLSLLFFLKRKNHFAARFFGLYLLVFSIGLLEPQLENTLNPALSILFIVASSNFLYGPLLYFFVESLLLNGFNLKWRHALHLLPFFTDIGFNAWRLLQPEANETFFGIMELIGFEILVAQVLAYNVLTIKKLRCYRQHIVQTYSNLESKDVKWLEWLFIFITCIYVLSFTLTHCIIFGLLQGRELYLLVQASIIFSIYLMSYRIILQPQLFLVNRTFSNEKNVNKNRKYQRSGLKEEQAEVHLKELLHYMQNQKPYLDPDVTINSVALALNVSKNHLTQTINEKLKRNFFEFVNEYRVNEVKQLLLNPDSKRLTLSAVGLQAGFKSKTAFYTNFKKLTGKTPTEWKKEAEPIPVSPPADTPVVQLSVSK